MRLSRSVLVLTSSVLVSACGGGSSTPNTPTAPTPPVTTPPPTPAPPANRAPVINSLTVNPTFAVSELTSVAITASGSDPDGDPVAYEWDLGDGTTGTGPAIAKLYRGRGVATVRLTITDGRGGSATDSRTVVVASLTGTWRGAGVQLGAFTMTLTQAGALVTGSYADAVGPGATDPAQPGSVNAQGAFEMRIKQGRFTDWNFRGQIDATGQRLTGQIFGSGFNGQAFTMDRQ